MMLAKKSKMQNEDAGSEEVEDAMLNEDAGSEEVEK